MYNKATLALDPPKPTLDWSGDFMLIKETNHDIMNKPWAKAVICKLIKKDQKLKHACKEIIQCNVEVRWLHTPIVNEEHHFTKCLLEIKDVGTPIYGAVEDFVTQRCHVNAALLIRISHIYSLPGFTSVLRPGIKKGSMEVDTFTKTIKVAGIANNLGSQRNFDDDFPQVEEDDNEEVEALNSIINYVGDLSIDA
ncbi:hypothetical protein C0995_013695 [Termitomyces sp. Mi166|nr:hypothetical protein C0995_013695 [Termitomyces sp. Mi166\